MACELHKPSHSLISLPVVEILLPFDFCVQPFLLRLAISDLTALRSSCSDLRRSADVHYEETHRAAMQSYLKEICANSGAVYAVYWTLKRGHGVLYALCHHNPEERINQVKGLSGDDVLYSTASYDFSFRPGQGVIGSVFANRKELSFEDIQALPDHMFVRKQLAQRFGIRSVAVSWYKGGVLEIGTVDTWTSFDWIVAHLGVDKDHFWEWQTGETHPDRVAHEEDEPGGGNPCQMGGDLDHIWDWHTSETHPYWDAKVQAGGNIPSHLGFDVDRLWEWHTRDTHPDSDEEEETYPSFLCNKNISELRIDLVHC